MTLLSDYSHRDPVASAPALSSSGTGPGLAGIEFASMATMGSWKNASQAFTLTFVGCAGLPGAFRKLQCSGYDRPILMVRLLMLHDGGITLRQIKHNIKRRQPQ